MTFFADILFSNDIFGIYENKVIWKKSTFINADPYRMSFTVAAAVIVFYKEHECPNFLWFDSKIVIPLHSHSITTNRNQKTTKLTPLYTYSIWCPECFFFISIAHAKLNRSHNFVSFRLNLFASGFFFHGWIFFFIYLSPYSYCLFNSCCIYGCVCLCVELQKARERTSERTKILKWVRCLPLLLLLLFSLSFFFSAVNRHHHRP